MLVCPDVACGTVTRSAAAGESLALAARAAAVLVGVVVLLGCAPRAPDCNGPGPPYITVTFECASPPTSVEVSGPGCEDGMIPISGGRALVATAHTGACQIVVRFASGETYSQTVGVTVDEGSGNLCGQAYATTQGFEATCYGDSGAD